MSSGQTAAHKQVLGAKFSTCYLVEEELSVPCLHHIDYSMQLRKDPHNCYCLLTGLAKYHKIELPQCDALEMVLHGPCRVFMCSTVLKRWSLVPGGNLLPLVFPSDASVILNILTWCCTRTQDILPHNMTSMKSPEDTDWDQQTCFCTHLIAHEILGIFVLRVSVPRCVNFIVRDEVTG